MKKGKVLFYEVQKDAEVREIDGSLESMYKLLNCSCIDMVRLPIIPGVLDHQYFMIIDDEGLLKEDAKLNRGQIAGNIMIVADDEESEGDSRGLTDEELFKLSNIMEVILPKADPDDEVPAPYMEFRSF
jgi:hypothetical protein